MTETTKIRGHHLKSLFGIAEVVRDYLGVKSSITRGAHASDLIDAGYTEGFEPSERGEVARRMIDSFYERATKLMQNPDNLVEIVAAEPDFVCAGCPLADRQRDKRGVCPSYKTDGGRKLDENSVKYLGLKVGNTYTVREIVNAVRKDLLGIAQVHMDWDLVRELKAVKASAVA